MPTSCSASTTTSSRRSSRTRRRSRGHELDTDLSADDWQARHRALQGHGRGGARQAFPAGPAGAALGRDRRRVRLLDEPARHHLSPPARHPGRLGHGRQRPGHGVRQHGRDSATGVAFTRNPSTGEKALYGEFLVNAQGEDVVAGIRTPQPITEAARIAAGSDKPSLEKLMPEAFAAFVGDLRPARSALPRHAGHRVHHRARQALDAADPHRQAHRQGGAEDRRRHGRRGADHRARRRSRASTRPRSTSCCTRPSTRSAERDVIATGLPASPGAASGEIVFTADEAEDARRRGPQGHPGAHRDQPRGHPRHARRRGHPDHARRHDQPRRRGGARHGQALRLRRRHAARRLPGRHADRAWARRFSKGDIITIDGAHRPGADRRGADAPAGAVGRFRHADGLGRRGAPHEGAHQCRDAARRAHRALVRRRGHRPLPHRAHVLRRRAHRRHARDDPRRHRGRPPRRARQAAADAALGFRRAVRDHGRPAGHHPPARSAAARVPAARPTRRSPRSPPP